MPGPAINQALCKKDGVCVQTCPMGLFVQPQKGSVPQVAHDELCLACGQCVAVCPQGAIAHGDYPAGSMKVARQELVPSYEQVMELIRTRRSVRAFRDRTVEREIVEKIVDAARLAPSAHNSQSTAFLVVQDRGVLRQITQLTAQYLHGVLRSVGNPVERSFLFSLDRDAVESTVPLLPDIESLVQAVAAGRDMFLFNAPALLVFHAPSSASYPAVNASLALQNASLAAHALGVGSFFTGYVVSAWQHDDRLRQLLRVPGGNLVYGALALGYPKFKYRSWIERQAPRIEWI